MAINVPVFERVLTLRQQLADLLGYATWADYVTEVKMAKSAENVIDFLADLEHKLHPLALKERDLLLAMKREEHEKKGLPFDGKFYAWDSSYYQAKYLKKALDLDVDLIKEYFPVPFVVATVLEIYQSSLDIEFVEVKADLWHPGMFCSLNYLFVLADGESTTDVQQFAVWKKDAKDESGFLGWCYLDLYPRGKRSPSHCSRDPQIT